MGHYQVPAGNHRSNPIMKSSFPSILGWSCRPFLGKKKILSLKRCITVWVLQTSAKLHHITSFASDPNGLLYPALLYLRKTPWEVDDPIQISAALERAIPIFRDTTKAIQYVAKSLPNWKRDSSPVFQRSIWTSTLFIAIAIFYEIYNISNQELEVQSKRNENRH